MRLSSQPVAPSVSKLICFHSLSFAITCCALLANPSPVLALFDTLPELTITSNTIAVIEIADRDDNSKGCCETLSDGTSSPIVTHHFRFLELIKSPAHLTIAPDTQLHSLLIAPRAPGRYLIFMIASSFESGEVFYSNRNIFAIEKDGQIPSIRKILVREDPSGRLDLRAVRDLIRPYHYDGKVADYLIPGVDLGMDPLGVMHLGGEGVVGVEDAEKLAAYDKLTTLHEIEFNFGCPIVIDASSPPCPKPADIPAEVSSFPAYINSQQIPSEKLRKLSRHNGYLQVRGVWRAGNLIVSSIDSFVGTPRDDGRTNLVFSSKTIEDLLPQLERDSPPAKRFALEALGKLGEKARPAVARILPLLQDTSPEVRQAAIGALFEIKPDDKSVIPHLVRVLTDDGFLVSYKAAELLKQFTPLEKQYFPLVLAGFRKAISGAYLDRGAAGIAYLLGQFGIDAKPAVPDFMDALAKTQGYEAGEISKALMLIQADRSEDASTKKHMDVLILSLRKAFADTESLLPEMDVSYALDSIKTLNRTDVTNRIQNEVVPILEKAMLDDTLRWKLRAAAANGLKDLGVLAKRALPNLVLALNTTIIGPEVEMSSLGKGPLSQDALRPYDDYEARKSLRYAAIQALGIIGHNSDLATTNSAVKILLDIVKKGGVESLFATSVFANFMPFSEEPLRELLDSPNAKTRETAIWSLNQAKANDERTLVRLRSLCTDPVSSVRLHALRALVANGTSADKDFAIDLLRKLANDSDEQTRSISQRLINAELSKH